MQSPESWGRKVTEAVIWRKMAAISAWISASGLSFSAKRVVEEAEFSCCCCCCSCSAVIGAEGSVGGLDLDFGGGAEIWTFLWLRAVNVSFSSSSFFMFSIVCGW